MNILNNSQRLILVPAHSSYLLRLSFGATLSPSFLGLLIHKDQEIHVLSAVKRSLKWCVSAGWNGDLSTLISARFSSSLVLLFLSFLESKVNGNFVKVNMKESMVSLSFSLVFSVTVFLRFRSIKKTRDR